MTADLHAKILTRNLKKTQQDCQPSDGEISYAVPSLLPFLQT
jgi:hypothetical protein